MGVNDWTEGLEGRGEESGSAGRVVKSLFADAKDDSVFRLQPLAQSFLSDFRVFSPRRESQQHSPHFLYFPINRSCWPFSLQIGLFGDFGRIGAV